MLRNDNSLSFGLNGISLSLKEIKFVLVSWIWHYFLIKFEFHVNLDASNFELEQCEAKNNTLKNPID
jgi:hypothetical protein